MRNILTLCILLLTLTSWQNRLFSQNNSNSENEKVKQYDQNDSVIGVYEYIYPDNTSNLIENHYIVIRKIENHYEGNYYGTSDEFDENREGYYPGFFIAPMENLEIKNKTIKFRLSVPNSKILTKAVDLKYNTYEEAIQNGYVNWRNKMTLNPKEYEGTFITKDTIFFKGEYEFMDKKFRKK